MICNDITGRSLPIQGDKPLRHQPECRWLYQDRKTCILGGKCCGVGCGGYQEAQKGVEQNEK